MAWAVDFAMILTSVPRLRALVGWMIAGALHLGISVSDAFLIAPQAMEIVETGWTSLAWHGLLAVAAVTLHALPIPIPRTRATL
jgi:hypothetical protein